ncbi:MAG: PQQ-dependent sugar dehydrogenase [Cellvibrionaceae bacterium]
MLLKLSILTVLMLQSAVVLAVTQSTFWKLEKVASGFGVPWGLAFVDDRKLLITERSGGLKLLNVATGTVQSISGAPKVLAEGQGGLLDVAIPKQLTEAFLMGGSKPGWIYFTYSKPVGDNAATTLARARLQGNRLTNLTDLLVTKSVTGTGYHYGSRIAFKIDEQDPAKSTVFFSVGDRGKRPNGQDLSNHAGTVLRLYLDGSVPKDNPFVGAQGALPEIWSYGHRNPQGLAYDPIADRLWMIEHGPRGGDEINLIKKGRNYGWPVVSHGKEYWGPFSVGEAEQKPGMEPAVKVYVPSIAPGSLLIYSGKAFSHWAGSLMSGALKLTHINRVDINSKAEAVHEERLLGDLNERIRAIVESAEGGIYFSTDSGDIYRILPHYPSKK